MYVLYTYSGGPYFATFEFYTSHPLIVFHCVKKHIWPNIDSIEQYLEVAQ